MAIWFPPVAFTGGPIDTVPTIETEPAFVSISGTQLRYAAFDRTPSQRGMTLGISASAFQIAIPAGKTKWRLGGIFRFSAISSGIFAYTQFIRVRNNTSLLATAGFVGESGLSTRVFRLVMTSPSSVTDDTHPVAVGDYVYFEVLYEYLPGNATKLDVYLWYDDPSGEPDLTISRTIAGTILPNNILIGPHTTTGARVQLAQPWVSDGERLAIDEIKWDYVNDNVTLRGTPYISSNGIETPVTEFEVV